MLKQKKYFILSLVVILTVVSVFPITALANTQTTDNQEYSISTIDEFKETISEVSMEGEISKSEKEALLAETDPEIVSEFAEEKVEAAMDEFNHIDPDLKEQPDGSFAFTETVDLGDDCYVIFDFTDKKELGIFDHLRNFFFEPAYAASNGEEVFKEFGNRYFTGSCTVAYIVGVAHFWLENHYNVSKNGLKENYGIADSWFAGTGSITEAQPQIITEKATAVGKSIGVRCNYKITAGVADVNASLSYTIKAYVTHNGFNTKKTGIYVWHEWKKISN